MGIHWLLSCLLLVLTFHQSSGGLKKLLKHFQKEEECHVVWEEHSQPHCSTTYEQECHTTHEEQCSTEYETECRQEVKTECKTEYEDVCKTKHVEQCRTENERRCETQHEERCSTEYTEECWEEKERVCKSVPDCHAVWEVQCSGGSKKYKRSAEEVTEAEVTEAELESMSSKEILDLINSESDGDLKIRGKRGVKILKKLLDHKSKKDDEPECREVAVEKCTEHEECWDEPKRRCKKTPHETCWQESLKRNV